MQAGFSAGGAHALTLGHIVQGFCDFFARGFELGKHGSAVFREAVTAHSAGKQENVVMLAEYALNNDVALVCLLVEPTGRVGTDAVREFAHGMNSLTAVDG